MIDFALHYARNSWRVFPLIPNGKIPLIPKERGGRGCLDATHDLRQIEAWWTDCPEANIGLATGNVLVVDVDPRKCANWLDSLTQLRLPSTLTIKTASGGFHLYFSLRADSQVRCGVDLLPGIDWRAHGGYVVACGSVVNGVVYEIAKNLPIADAPASLLERIATKRKAKTIVRDAGGQMVIKHGNRNSQLMRIGCGLRHWGVDFNAILESLRAINTDHCEPCLDDDELRTIAASCATYRPADAPKETA